MNASLNFQCYLTRAAATAIIQIIYHADGTPATYNNRWESQHERVENKVEKCL